jgi:hypothetical protein
MKSYCLSIKDLSLKRNEGIMSDSQRKYRRLVLAAIYIAYCGITAFCIHTHIVNGVTYVHHHTNKSHDHGGNLAEVILFSNQCSSIENITITELKISCYLRVIGEINDCRTQSVILQKRTCEFFLRPPPVHSSYLV